MEPTTALTARTDLAKVETALAEFEKIEAGLAALNQKYTGVVFDVKTTAGMKDAIAARAEIREPRYATEHARKAGKAPVIAIGKNIEEKAAWITAELLKIEDPIDAQIKAEETRKEAEKAARELAERERRERILARIQEIKDAGDKFTVRAGSAVLALHLEEARATEIDDTFAEFKPDAEAAKVRAVAKLTDLHSSALELEEAQRAARAQAEELARLKAEEDARQKEAVAREAEAIRKQAAEEKAAREKIAAEEQAANERIAAQQRAADEAMARAAAAERERLAAQEAEAKRIRNEEEKRLQVERDRITAEARALEDRQRAERAEVEARERAAREAKEAEEREAREMALSEIHGIQQQVIIAQVGRAGVRKGGTIECIRETLAETEAWPIQGHFHGMYELMADKAKTDAVNEIRALLDDATRREKREAAEAEAREKQRKADELLGGRALLQTFVDRYSAVDEFKDIAETIGEFLGGKKKSVGKKAAAQAGAKERAVSS